MRIPKLDPDRPDETFQSVFDDIIERLRRGKVSDNLITGVQIALRLSFQAGAVSAAKRIKEGPE